MLELRDKIKKNVMSQQIKDLKSKLKKAQQVNQQLLEERQFLDSIEDQLQNIKDENAAKHIRQKL